MFDQGSQSSNLNTSILNRGLKLFADELHIKHPNIFQFLTDQLQTGILIVDADFNMVYSNPFFCEMLGYTSAELIGKHLLSPMDEKGRTIALHYMQRRRDGISEAHPFTWIKKHGGEIHTTIHTTPIQNSEGKFFGAVGIIHDVTEETRTIERLRVSEGRYRALEQCARSFSWEVDCNGLYTFVSHNVEELIGYTPEEICHKVHFYDICPEFYREALKKEGLELMRKEEMFRNSVNPILTKNETIIWVRTNGMPIYDPEGNMTGYQGTDTDITEKHLIASKLLEATEQIEVLTNQALLAREDERATLARELHDQIGQSLTAIRFNLDYFSGHEILSPELQERISKLNDMVQQNINLVQTYSFDLRPIELQTKGLTVSIADYCARFRADTGILCTHFIDDPGTLHENLELVLFRIMQEALTNVARHAGATRVEVRISRTGNSVHLTIADNGKGIAAAEEICPRSIGLKGMRERAGYFGGTVQISVNGGTQVKAVIPLSENHSTPE